jgi:hypothetical protein
MDQCSGHDIPPAIRGDLTSQQGHDLDLGLNGPGARSAHLLVALADHPHPQLGARRSIPIRRPRTRPADLGFPGGDLRRSEKLPESGPYVRTPVCPAHHLPVFAAHQFGSGCSPAVLASCRGTAWYGVVRVDILTV